MTASFVNYNLLIFVQALIALSSITPSSWLDRSGVERTSRSNCSLELQLESLRARHNKGGSLVRSFKLWCLIWGLKDICSRKLWTCFNPCMPSGPFNQFKGANARYSCGTVSSLEKLGWNFVIDENASFNFQGFETQIGVTDILSKSENSTVQPSFWAPDPVK